MASQLDFAGGTFVDGLVGEASDPFTVADAAPEIHRPVVIAFVGLAFEARIAAGPGVKVVCRTAGSELETVADTAVRQGYRGMISFGVAGGLAVAPARRRLGCRLRRSVNRIPCRTTDRRVWSRKLLGMIDGAIHAPIVGVDTPVARTGQKARTSQNHRRRRGRYGIPRRWRASPPSTSSRLRRCGWWSIRPTAPCRRPR